MRLLLVAITALALTGCANDQSELRDWMQTVRAETKPVHEPISEPRNFAPYLYDNHAEVDPFSSAKLAGMADVAGRAPRDGLKPDLARRREALEGFPLDTIRLVGHLSNRDGSYALLQAENLIFQAGVGNFAGQNFGKITKISETEIKLKELVQDAVGDWIEREAALQIQDGSSK